MHTMLVGKVQSAGGIRQLSVGESKCQEYEACPNVLARSNRFTNGFFFR